MRFRGLRAATGAAVMAVMLVLAGSQAASAVPLPPVGPGWALVLDSTAGMTQRSTADTLYLVAPAGRRYPLARIPDTDAGAHLIAWSGDGTRALVELPGGAVEQITLASGQVHRVGLPAGVTVLGYSRPDGLNILGESTSGSVTTLARYTLSGALAQVSPRGPIARHRPPHPRCSARRRLRRRRARSWWYPAPPRSAWSATSVA
jgi:hypothetical protein